MHKQSKKIHEYKKELIDIICEIKADKNFMTEFLLDILTPSEFEDLALRWQIVKKLSKGETHREVAGELGLGISTVTRGSRELRNKHGGFTLMLQKIAKKK